MSTLSARRMWMKRRRTRRLRLSATITVLHPLGFKPGVVDKWSLLFLLVFLPILLLLKTVSYFWRERCWYITWLKGWSFPSLYTGLITRTLCCQLSPVWGCKIYYKEVWSCLQWTENSNVSKVKKNCVSRNIKKKYLNFFDWLIIKTSINILPLLRVGLLQLKNTHFI